MNPPTINRSKNELGHIIEKIKSDSSVGIDAQYTHAVIIDFLLQINERLNKIEHKISSYEPK